MGSSFWLKSSVLFRLRAPLESLRVFLAMPSGSGSSQLLESSTLSGVVSVPDSDSEEVETVSIIRTLLTRMPIAPKKMPQPRISDAPSMSIAPKKMPQPSLFPISKKRARAVYQGENSLASRSVANRTPLTIGIDVHGVLMIDDCTCAPGAIQFMKHLMRLFTWAHIYILSHVKSRVYHDRRSRRWPALRDAVLCHVFDLFDSQYLDALMEDHVFFNHYSKGSQISELGLSIFVDDDMRHLCGALDAAASRSSLLLILLDDAHTSQKAAHRRFSVYEQQLLHSGSIRVCSSFDEAFRVIADFCGSLC